MKPHILLLMADQFRFDAVSPEVTPNIYHRLQQFNGSTVFSRGYTATPICTPARAGLLTGKSPWAHGMLGYSNYVDCVNYATTLPRMLRRFHNYHTAAIGKNHFGPVKHTQGYQDETLYEALYSMVDDYVEWFNKSMPNMNPLKTCGLQFNDWGACPYVYDESYHPTSWTTRNVLDYLKDYFEGDGTQQSYFEVDPDGHLQEYYFEDANGDLQQERQPLLLKVSYHRPHSPYDPPERFFDEYLEGGSKSNIPQLDRFVNDSSWDRKFKYATMNSQAYAGDPGKEKARYSRAAYLANVEFVDEGIGQILDYLESNHLLDQFMIIWISDHGDQNGDHYLWRKGVPWEGSTHVPFAIKLASSSSDKKPLPPARVSDALVELRDVAPTIYDAVGILDQVQALDPLMDGKSLLPLVNGTVSSVREWVGLELYARWNALVGYLPNNAYCDYWKYIFNAFDGSEQLFCLSKDPNEAYDLSSLYTGVTTTWRQRMISQFETENRGDIWVKNGKLQVQKNYVVYARNYPCKDGT